LADALFPRASHITLGEYNEDQKAVFEAAREAGSRYVYMPAIVSWIARAPMLFRTSHVTVDIKIFDLSRPAGNELVLHKNLHEKGRNNVSARQKPDALVQVMFEKFVNSLQK
jgi:hypothetical protein